MTVRKQYWEPKKRLTCFGVSDVHSSKTTGLFTTTRVKRKSGRQEVLSAAFLKVYNNRRAASAAATRESAPSRRFGFNRKQNQDVPFGVVPPPPMPVRPTLRSILSSLQPRTHIHSQRILPEMASRRPCTVCGRDYNASTRLTILNSIVWSSTPKPIHTQRVCH